MNMVENLQDIPGGFFVSNNQSESVLDTIRWIEPYRIITLLLYCLHCFSARAWFLSNLTKTKKTQ